MCVLVCVSKHTAQGMTHLSSSRFLQGLIPRVPYNYSYHLLSTYYTGHFTCIISIPPNTLSAGICYLHFAEVQISYDSCQGHS